LFLPFEQLKWQVFSSYENTNEILLWKIANLVHGVRYSFRVRLDHMLIAAWISEVEAATMRKRGFRRQV
jgi:hypothetical protein